MATIQVWVSDEMAERVVRAAGNDGRSVSQWVRLLLERELSGVRSLSDTERPSRVAGVPKGARALCPHDNVRKEAGAAGGIVKTCLDCEARLLS